MRHANMLAICMLLVVPNVQGFESNRDAGSESHALPNPKPSSNRPINVDPFRVDIVSAYFRTPDSPPIAFVHENHFIDKANIRIEKRRTVERINKDHPVWVEVYYSSEKGKNIIRQSFNLRDNKVVAQVPQICQFVDPELCDFRSTTPFYGPFTPANASFEELVRKLHEESALSKPSENTEHYSLAGSVDDVGHFEIFFPTEQMAKPSRIVRTMKTGDKITTRRQLGFVDGKPDPRERAIISETDDWYDLVYADSEGHPKILAATRLLTTCRRDGSSDRHYAKIEFTYPKPVNVDHRLVWEDSFLEVKNGLAAESHPEDHRRFEFINNRIVLVVDESAMQAIDTAEFSSKSTFSIQQILFAGLAALVAGVVFCVIYLSRKSPT